MKVRLTAILNFLLICSIIYIICRITFIYSIRELFITFIKAFIRG